MAAWALSAPAHGQLGAGWVETEHTRAIHLDGDTGDDTTFSWSESRSNCTPEPCADYDYDSATDTETFRIFDSRSNRSEIRLYNDYTTGSRQFEGYVTFFSPLEDECLMQIWGSTSGATQLMIRGFQANGGELRGGGAVLASNCYENEKRVNVIHLQEDVGNAIMIYIDSVLIEEIADNEAISNYHKYGVYGTTSGNVPAVAEWRAVRTFRDGTPPDDSSPGGSGSGGASGEGGANASGGANGGGGGSSGNGGSVSAGGNTGIAGSEASGAAGSINGGVAGVGGTDGGLAVAGTGTTNPGSPTGNHAQSGCGCEVVANARQSPLLALPLLLLGVVRRRRQRTGRSASR